MTEPELTPIPGQPRVRLAGVARALGIKQIERVKVSQLAEQRKLFDASGHIDLETLQELLVEVRHGTP